MRIVWVVAGRSESAMIVLVIPGGAAIAAVISVIRGVTKFDVVAWQRDKKFERSA
jgi:hypothetical protein